MSALGHELPRNQIRGAALSRKLPRLSPTGRPLRGISGHDVAATLDIAGEDAERSLMLTPERNPTRGPRLANNKW